MISEKIIMISMWIITWGIISKMIYDNCKKDGSDPWFTIVCIPGFWGVITLLVVWIA